MMLSSLSPSDLHHHEALFPISISTDTHMATNQAPPPFFPCPGKTHCVDQDHDHEEEDEQYIDMEVSSSSSPPQVQVREFEFQMGSSSHERDSITSPADELFYKGKLLPLHLPPRLQMVQKMLQNPPNNKNPIFEGKTDEGFEDGSVISPAESCRASSELNPDEFLFISTTAGPAGSNMGIETSDLMQNHPDGHFFDWCQHQRHQIRKCPSWHRKLERIKQSQLGQKIRASRAYLRSLFSKTGCSGDSFPSEAAQESALSLNLNRYVKIGKRNKNNPLVRGTEREITVAEEGGGNAAQRRSFSGAIKWHSAPKCSSSSTASSASSSSSSFSFTSSNGYYDLHLLKRSNSANSELESSIEGAIAHCKQSSSCLVQERLVVK